MCPQTTMCPLTIDVYSYNYRRRITQAQWHRKRAPIYLTTTMFYKCVLILLFLCPHTTTICVPSYYYRRRITQTQRHRKRAPIYLTTTMLYKCVLLLLLQASHHTDSMTSKTSAHIPHNYSLRVWTAQGRNEIIHSKRGGARGRERGRYKVCALA